MNVNEPGSDGRPRSALQMIKGGRGIGFNYAVATGAYREEYAEVASESVREVIKSHFPPDQR